MGAAEGPLPSSEGGPSPSGSRGSSPSRTHANAAAASSGVSGAAVSGSMGSKRARAALDEEVSLLQQLMEEAESGTGKEYVPLKKRKALREKLLKKQLQALNAHLEREDGAPTISDEEEDKAAKEKGAKQKEAAISKARLDFRKTLLATSRKLRQEAERNKKDVEQEIEEEEQRILEQVTKSLGAPLQGVRERAKGIVYSQRMETSWVLPTKYQEMTEEEAKEVRERFFVDVNGSDVPPPFRNFKDMCFPQPILDALKMKNITAPTQIQMQVLVLQLSSFLWSSE
ncbi:hypothetical protein ACSSS7_002151 [Eimeria intestinalis]